MNRLHVARAALTHEPFNNARVFYHNDFDGADPFNGFVGDWILGTDWKASGTYALKSSNYHKPNTTSTTTLTFTTGAPARIDFDWFVYSEGNYDKLTVTLDGTTILGPYGDYNGIPGHYTGFIDTPGTHVMVFSYHKDSSGDTGLDIAAVDNILVQEMTFARFINFSVDKGPFTGAWALSTAWSYDDDGQSLASTNHANSSTSSDSAALKFDHPGWLTGAYHTSSEGGYDKLYVGVDSTNNCVNGASGNTSSGTFKHFVGDSSALNVSYTKDSSSSAGLDTVFVDAFGFYLPHCRTIWEDDFTQSTDTDDCYDAVSATPGSWMRDSSGMLVATGTSQSIYLNNQKTFRDGYAEVVATQADDGGMVIHSDDPTHYLLMTWQDASATTTANHINLYRCIGTTFTSISGSIAMPAWVRGTERRFQLQLDGSYLSMYVDGKLLYSAAQTTYTGGAIPNKFGFRSNAGTNIFKSIKAVTK